MRCLLRPEQKRKRERKARKGRKEEKKAFFLFFPHSVLSSPAPIVTTEKECEEMCARVAANAERWNAVTAQKKLEYIREMIGIYREINAEVGRRARAAVGRSPGCIGAPIAPPPIS